MVVDQVQKIQLVCACVEKRLSNLSMQWPLDRRFELRVAPAAASPCCPCVGRVDRHGRRVRFAVGTRIRAAVVAQVNNIAREFQNRNSGTKECRPTTVQMWRVQAARSCQRSSAKPSREDLWRLAHECTCTCDTRALTPFLATNTNCGFGHRQSLRSGPRRRTWPTAKCLLKSCGDPAPQEWVRTPERLAVRGISQPLPKGFNAVFLSTTSVGLVSGASP